jgi:pimeloyl-ACP methyl ester carboxylesterase
VRVVLVHSPLVGPVTWRPTAAELTGRGFEVVVPDARSVWSAEAPYVERIVETVAPGAVASGTVGVETPTVLVAHSGAGPLLPAIADRLGRSVRALVFVDALLPYPNRSWFDEAPPDWAVHVRGLARDGLLPPWPEWFPAEALPELIPDADQRAALVGDVPRIRMSYLDEPMPSASWTGPAGYVQLSDAYADQADQAYARGFAVDVLRADHLATFTRPVEVAAAIDRLVTAIG